MNQPSHITRNTQIGNISVKQIAASLGSDPDHLVEVLEDVFAATPIYGGAIYTGARVTMTSTILQY